MDLANTGDVNNDGAVIERLSIYAKSGSTGGTAISMVSSATAAQKRILIDWVYIAGTGTWQYNIRANGALNSSGEPGVQSISVRHSILAKAQVVGLQALAFVYLTIDQVNIYYVFGNLDLELDGGGGITSSHAVVTCVQCSLVSIGATSATEDVSFTTQFTTTLTVSSSLTNFSYIGTIGSLSGSATASASTPGVMVPGRGLFGVGGPTSGGGHLETADGVTFPATLVPSANVNTLDDYEVGTFVPTIVGTTSAGTTTYTTQLGWYQKVGRYVHIDIQLVWTNMTGTGNLLVGALPFASTTEAGYVSPAAVSYSNLVVGAGLQLVAYIPDTSVTILLRKADPAGGAAAAIAVDTAGTLMLSATYRATQ
jgi:hypothetical protein